LKKIFLTAKWEKLAMANYEVNPQILVPYLPNHTELDFFDGKCFVSLVGFMFRNTRLKGIPIPFHQNFEEVNLRFYVRYKEGNAWKRGTVFIKEIVPKFMISLVANTLYEEHYETRPMKHQWKFGPEKLDVEYLWKTGKWNKFKISTSTLPVEIKDGSEEEFITEHYWGYTQLKNGKTSEFGVEHPKWQVYNTIDYTIDCNFGLNYGQGFQFLNSEKPNSVFLAEGSEIIVRNGRKI
jgi:uncharacterized protein YqjF (DUF2071 family)